MDEETFCYKYLKGEAKTEQPKKKMFKTKLEIAISSLNIFQSAFLEH